LSSTDWTERYLAHPDPWGITPAATIVSQVASAQEAGLEPGTAVDLGSGDGRHARWLAGLGWNVSAVDISAEVIDSARERDSDEGRPGHVEWIAADGLEWEPESPVDLVVVGFLQLPADTLGAILHRAAGWLAPGGHLVYLGHAAENMRRGVGGPQDPSTLPSIEELAAAAKGLRVLSLRHDIRPAGTAVAVDVILHAAAWAD